MKGAGTYLVKHTNMQMNTTPEQTNEKKIKLSKAQTQNEMNHNTDDKRSMLGWQYMRVTCKSTMDINGRKRNHKPCHTHTISIGNVTQQDQQWIHKHKYNKQYNSKTWCNQFEPCKAPMHLEEHQ